MDIKDLPTNPNPTTNNDGGRAPDPIETTWIAPILEKWAQQYNEDHGHRAMSIPDRMFRASWAGSCTRRIQYQMQQIPATNPPDEVSQWSFFLGHTVHDAVQAIAAEYGGDLEVAVDLAPLGISGAATADIVVDDPSAGLGVIELKSMNGYGFKLAAGAMRGPAEGPKDTAVRQAALSAAALDADWMKIVVVGLERASKFDGLAQIAAEWTYSRPEIAAIAGDEVARIRAVETAIAEDRLVRRHMPDMPKGAEIMDPSSSAWILPSRDGGVPERAGQVWGGRYCDYCSHRDVCVKDGPTSEVEPW